MPFVWGCISDSVPSAFRKGEGTEKGGATLFGSPADSAWREFTPVPACLLASLIGPLRETCAWPWGDIDGRMGSFDS